MTKKVLGVSIDVVTGPLVGSPEGQRRLGAFNLAPQSTGVVCLYFGFRPENGS